jgi:broad specificity phosphatase PhoE
MKQILILRHAAWDLRADTLTDDAKAACTALKPQLPDVSLSISSSLNRAKECAQLLTGAEPTVDDRAGFPKLTPEVFAQIAVARRTHPLGVAGSIFAIPAAREPYRTQAVLFLDLIKETFEKLHDNQTALIVSHDGIMVALEKVLDNSSFEGTDHTYPELAGFFLDESLAQRSFTPVEPAETPDPTVDPNTTQP